MKQILAVADEAEASITDLPDGELEGRKLSRELAQTLKLDLSEAPEEIIGQKIGRYGILVRVGEGGSGVVYVAEQTDPVLRRFLMPARRLGGATRCSISKLPSPFQRR